jgi:hypothetical protein
VCNFLADGPPGGESHTWKIGRGERGGGCGGCAVGILARKAGGVLGERVVDCAY